MVGRRRGVFLAAALAVKFAALIGCSGAMAQEQPAPACGGDVIARGVAKRVIDGRTFTLDDGREVRLAAVEVPPLETGAAPGAAAEAALDALVGGDDTELIASGLARVGDHVGGRSCALALLKSENAARGAKLGLWADSHYDVLDAETPTDVLARRG